MLAVERVFQVEVDPATLTGRIDRIDRRPDGSLALLDYKSSRRAMALADAGADLQLALYAVACAVDPELQALGDVGEVVYVYPRLQAHGRVVRREQPVTPDLVERTRQRIVGLVADIAAERFDFSEEVDCRFCEFKGICLRHHGGDVPL